VVNLETTVNKIQSYLKRVVKYSKFYHTERYLTAHIMMLNCISQGSVATSLACDGILNE